MKLGFGPYSLMAVAAFLLTSTIINAERSDGKIVQRSNNVNHRHRQDQHQRYTKTDIEGESPTIYELANYQPVHPNLVVDAARIDLDQADIEQSMLFFNFGDAQTIYEDGGHSFSVATLRLDIPLSEDMPPQTIVLGQSESGGIVRGTLLYEAKALVTLINVAYTPINVGVDGFDDPKDDSNLCQLGGSLVPKTMGCYAENGRLSIGGLDDVTYSGYDATTDTINLRSIQRFSTDTSIIFTNPLPTHQKFVDYFGDTAYGDIFIQSAIDGKPASDKLKRGNIDFTLISVEGRAAAIPRFTFQLNIWMYVAGLLEFTIEKCLDDDNTMTDKTITSEEYTAYWDESWAIYAGSLEGVNGTTEEGKLLYHLADEMCGTFDTCDNDDDGDETATVNRKIVEDYQKGQTQVLNGQCDAAKATKEAIVSRMTVPLLQGMLLSAFEQEGGDKGDENVVDQVIGFSYAISVLPLIHACETNQLAATVIYDAFSVPPVSETDFASIRSVLEASYECLGVTCDDIGSLAGADLCTGAKNSTTNSSADECEEEGECSSGNPMHFSALGLNTCVLSLALYYLLG